MTNMSISFLKIYQKNEKKVDCMKKKKMENLPHTKIVCDFAKDCDLYWYANLGEEGITDEYYDSASHVREISRSIKRYIEEEEYKDAVEMLKELKNAAKKFKASGNARWVIQNFTPPTSQIPYQFHEITMMINRAIRECDKRWEDDICI